MYFITWAPVQDECDRATITWLDGSYSTQMFEDRRSPAANKGWVRFLIRTATQHRPESIPISRCIRFILPSHRNYMPTTCHTYIPLIPRRHSASIASIRPSSAHQHHNIDLSKRCPSWILRSSTAMKTGLISPSHGYVNACKTAYLRESIVRASSKRLALLDPCVAILATDKTSAADVNNRKQITPTARRVDRCGTCFVGYERG